MKTMIRVLITKYALTTGIECAEVELDDRWPKSVYRMGKSGLSGVFFNGEGKDWHRTPESAIKRAEIMRDEKIISLKKQINKLERKTFKVEA